MTVLFTANNFATWSSSVVPLAVVESLIIFTRS
jgi:hypothetical protein